MIGRQAFAIPLITAIFVFVFNCLLSPAVNPTDRYTKLEDKYIELQYRNSKLNTNYGKLKDKYLDLQNENAILQLYYTAIFEECKPAGIIKLNCKHSN